MAEERERGISNMLTAEELLRNKGIRSVVWDEFEKSSNVLPKNGKKQFEPNHLWLQNMQIEKGIKNRRDLIGIERVERVSQLASAEWLPEQKKARVKKISGQDWGNFGLERNGALYLIPEEALFLLEANCMELMWNDVPLSIQQAYDLLIDNVECSMEEYRVYSQLVRNGYRIQRFVYAAERNPKVENVGGKRKVIVDPENGLRMSEAQSQVPLNKESRNCEKRAENTDPDIQICKGAIPEDRPVEKEVSEILENLLREVETQCDNQSADDSNNKVQATKMNGDSRKRNNKVEIISKETLIGNIKIVTKGLDKSVKDSNIESRWKGSRIQRNVKLLPKRTDKPAAVDVSVVEFNNESSNNCLEKRKASAPPDEEQRTKRPRQEVIELSDDEIQILPKCMTRMELLNLIPNIASRSTVSVKIARGYIPHNIKPQKSVYHYESNKLRNLHESDKRLRSRTDEPNNSVKQTTSHCRNEVVGRTSLPLRNGNREVSVQDPFVREFYPVQRGQCTQFNPPYLYNNRFPFAFNQTAYWPRYTLVQRNMFQNVFVSLGNDENAFHYNRFWSFLMNNFALPGVTNMSRNPFIRNQYRHSFYQNVTPQQKFYQHRMMENMSVNCGAARNLPNVNFRQRQPLRDTHRESGMSNHYRGVYQSSFKPLPGASSWTELKAKWREEKTITIDDENSNKDDVTDCNEVEVVEEFSSPLIGHKNVGSLEEIFERLRIIKSAPEKTVRRKKSRYKISYNVYSSTQHYRKANPGVPLYRVIVIRQKDDLFLQPIELHRLQQDAKNSPIVLACVSMSISYIQPGFISLPNLT